MSFSYVTSDGQRRAESSFIVKPKGQEPYTVVSGFYSYIGTDGLEYIVGYISDLYGYRTKVVTSSPGTSQVRDADFTRFLNDLAVDMDVPQELLRFGVNDPEFVNYGNPNYFS